MASVLWSAVNVALFLGLLYIFFRAAQLVRRHIGLGAALFFVFGLLLVGCTKSGNQSSQSTTQNMLSGIAKDTPLGNGSALKRIPMGYNKLILLAEYRQENGIIKPRGLFATVSGVLVGHSWQPITGSLRQRRQQLHYTAIMRHTWNLLSIPVYNNMEQFEGEMLVSEAHL